MTDLSRRQFLLRFGSAAVAAAALPMIDVERLLWVPGQKTIFLPSRTPLDMWVVESLKVLQQTLTFSAHVNRQYDDLWRQKLQVGDSVSIRLPRRYTLNG